MGAACGLWRSSARIVDEEIRLRARNDEVTGRCHHPLHTTQRAWARREMTAASAASGGESSRAMLRSTAISQCLSRTSSTTQGRRRGREAFTVVSVRI